MADAFVFSKAQFQDIFSNYLSLEGAISIPYTHHFGGDAVRAHSGDCQSLAGVPMLGLNSTPYAAEGSIDDAYAVYFDPSSRGSIIL